MVPITPYPYGPCQEEAVEPSESERSSEARSNSSLSSNSTTSTVDQVPPPQQFSAAQQLPAITFQDGTSMLAHIDDLIQRLEAVKIEIHTPGYVTSPSASPPTPSFEDLGNDLEQQLRGLAELWESKEDICLFLLAMQDLRVRIDVLSLTPVTNPAVWARVVYDGSAVEEKVDLNKPGTYIGEELATFFNAHTDLSVEKTRQKAAVADEVLEKVAVHLEGALILAAMATEDGLKDLVFTKLALREMISRGCLEEKREIETVYESLGEKRY